MKSLERYYTINQRIYSRLIDEVREYSFMTKPRHGENVYDISGYGGHIIALLSEIKRFERIIFEIINNKFRSKNDYVSMYKAFKKEMPIFRGIDEHVFYKMNQLSLLLPLYEKCLQLLEEHRKKLEEKGINLAETEAFLNGNEVVSLVYVEFFKLIREQFKNDVKATVSRYSEHYRSVVADLTAHHKTILAKHERVHALTLRLPISSCNKYNFTEIEIDNYLLAICKFLNNLRKNKTLKHIVGYVVGRSFIAEEYPSVSIILFFSGRSAHSFKYSEVIKETVNYWTKTYNRLIKPKTPLPLIDEAFVNSPIFEKLTMNNVDSFVNNYSAPLALQGDVIRFKNAPKRKKYYSRSEKL